MRCGASQILLGDRPALTTQRRLAQGIWAALVPRAIAGALALNAAVFANALGYLSAGDTQAAVGVTVAATVALVVAPVVLPFAEIFAFSRMSADDVEAAVTVPEDVQSNLGTALKLYGEDALLDWPGARESVIAERDTFMARALAAAARGAPPACTLQPADSCCPFIQVFCTTCPRLCVIEQLPPTACQIGWICCRRERASAGVRGRHERGPARAALHDG